MSAAPIPFFGRSFKVQVTTAAAGTVTLADSSWGNESLRITFETERLITMEEAPYSTADISIYNLDTATQNLVINQGDEVTLSAGYDYNKDTVIFQGKLFQPLAERVDVIDSKLTLRCIDWLLEDKSVHVEVTISAPSTQLDAVKLVAAQAGITSRDLDEVTLTQKKFPRGRTITGSAMKYFLEVASDNHLGISIWNGKLTMKSLTPNSDVPFQVFAPVHTDAPQTTGGLTKQTLIGTPQQTERGVIFRVLLDSTVDLWQLVKLASPTVRRIPIAPNPTTIPVVNTDGLYAVISIRHSGDSRGNDWYTECGCVTREWEQLGLGTAAG